MALRWWSSVLLALALAGAGSALASHDVEPDVIPPDDADAVYDAPCVAGAAADFACRNVDLLALLPLSVFGEGQANDVWGWTWTPPGHGDSPPIQELEPEQIWLLLWLLLRSWLGDDAHPGDEPADAEHDHTDHAHEYALIGLRGGTAFVDVTDPTAPIYVGFLPSHTTGSSWRDIKTYADHAFIVSEAPAHGMQVFDLNQLVEVENPPVVFSETAHYAGFYNAHNIAINEETGYAYAVGTNTCAGGLHMIDIRQPTAPAFAGCFSADGYTHDVHCVIYHGPRPGFEGHEICFASNENTVTIVDVTDKSAPSQISRASYAFAGYVHQAWLTEDHRYLFVDDEFDEITFGHGSRTHVFDVSFLFPVEVGDYTSTSSAIDHNLYVVRNHVFEANYRSGLRILRTGDLSVPELVEVAYLDTFPADDLPRFSGAWSVYPFFESGTVVVSDINRGLFVLKPDLRAVAECDDGIDNDGDGAVDLDDDHCGLPRSTRESTECGDGYDNDEDGLVDLDDPDCRAEDDITEACGLGFELALLLPFLRALRRRRIAPRRA